MQWPNERQSNKQLSQNTTQKTYIETGRGLNSDDPGRQPVPVPLVVSSCCSCYSSGDKP